MRLELERCLVAQPTGGIHQRGTAQVQIGERVIHQRVRRQSPRSLEAIEHIRRLPESSQRMTLKVDRGKAVRVLAGEIPGDPQLVPVVAQRMVRHREIPPVKRFPAVGEPSEIALGIESPQDFDRLAGSPGQPSEQSPEHLKLWEARQSRGRLTQDPRRGLVIPSTGRELRIQLKAV